MSHYCLTGCVSPERAAALGDIYVAVRWISRRLVVNFGADGDRYFLGSEKVW